MLVLWASGFPLRRVGGLSGSDHTVITVTGTRGRVLDQPTERASVDLGSSGA